MNIEQCFFFRNLDSTLDVQCSMFDVRIQEVMVLKFTRMPAGAPIQADPDPAFFGFMNNPG